MNKQAAIYLKSRLREIQGAKAKRIFRDRFKNHQGWLAYNVGAKAFIGRQHGV